MNTLNGQQLLYLWEIGHYLHPLDRALTILSVALPDAPASELINLTLGQRNALLFLVRKATFGDSLNHVVNCPECGEQMEFSQKIKDLLKIAPDPETIPSSIEFDYQDYRLVCQVPTSLDIANIINQEDDHLHSIAKKVTLQSVLELHHKGKMIENSVLPEELVPEIIKKLQEADSFAELFSRIDCVKCQFSWKAVFEIGDYLWQEISTHAKMLMRDVDYLSKSYGWSEHEILAMTAMRRQRYIELAQA